jgi:clan AA aspartic protease
MIRGIVTENREAIIRLTVLGSGSRKRSIEAVVDTGYDGDLSLPPNLITKLGLVWRRRGRAEMADGTISTFDIYDGAVMWDSRRRKVLVDEADAVPLIGMSLLANCALRVEVWPGGQVTATRRR